MNETPEPTMTSDIAAAGDARWNAEKDALIDALWTLGYTQEPVSRDVISDVIGYMRNKHDVLVIPAEWHRLRATPDAGGAVMISRELLTRLRDACIGLDMFGLAVDIDEVLDPAIAASGGHDGGE